MGFLFFDVDKAAALGWALRFGLAGTLPAHMKTGGNAAF
jgi:hypothetical protein